MGHASILITMDRYAYLFDAKADDAAQMAELEGRFLG
jgi:hypothetical protein